MSARDISLTDREHVQKLLKECDKYMWRDLWTMMDVIILFPGVVANASLLWLFLKEVKSLSASKVLGLNLVLMDLLYLSFMPVSLVFDFMKEDKGNSSDSGNTTDDHDDDYPPINVARDFFSFFNLIGCPLLLTCMCLERYLAVVKPVFYLRIRKIKNYLSVSAVVWLFTWFYALASVSSHVIIEVPVSLSISCLFIVMLACLGGMVWSLQQKCPAQSSQGQQARLESPLKRRAIKNLLFVVGSAIGSYLPVLFMVPLSLLVIFERLLLDEMWCLVLEVCVTFPRFGVFIGPLFYLTMAQRMCCLKGTRKTSND